MLQSCRIVHQPPIRHMRATSALETLVRVDLSEQLSGTAMVKRGHVAPGGTRCCGSCSVLVACMVIDVVVHIARQNGPHRLAPRFGLIDKPDERHKLHPQLAQVAQGRRRFVGNSGVRCVCLDYVLAASAQTRISLATHWGGISRRSGATPRRYSSTI